MKKNLGFTLIELLVVISIISLLSSVILVSVQSARQKAEESAYRIYMGEVVKAVELYRLEHGSLPTALPSTGPTLDSLITNSLSPYIKLQATPSFVINYVSGSAYYPGYKNFNENYYTLDCNNDKTADFMLLFQSSRDLKFPEVYMRENPGVLYSTSSGSPRWYCVSPTSM